MLECDKQLFRRNPTNTDTFVAIPFRCVDYPDYSARIYSNYGADVKYEEGEEEKYRPSEHERMHENNGQNYGHSNEEGEYDDRY